MMRDWDGNIYYSPEKCGFALVAMLEDETLSYEFDMVIVLKDEEGRLWAAHDAGCSCPTPFEYHENTSDLTEIRTIEELEQFVVANGYRHYSRAGISSFLGKVKEALSDVTRKS